MQTTNYHQFEEVKHQFYLENRLKVTVIEKKHFSKTYVTLSTPIGSTTKGYIDENHESIKVPEGIAHFLEHKIFEADGLDISTLFSAHEASINAFTEHNRTTYLFSATNHVLTNTKRLIDMFFYPKFTEAGVNKEKNIIKEELNMYLDDPYYTQYHHLLNMLYHNHAIKEDILGTKESIDAIDLQTLKAMHETYYQPELAQLIVIGDVDIKELKVYLEEQVKLPNPTQKTVEHQSVEEPLDVVKQEAVIEQDILIPSVLYGIKLPPNHDSNPSQAIKHRLSFTIFMDMLFGKTSDIYENFMNQSLINDTYGLDVTIEDNYAYALIGSESKQPEAFIKAIKTSIENADADALIDSDFMRFKKQMIGSFIQSLDSLESLAHQMNKYLHESISFYEVLSLAQSITLDDVKAHIYAIKDVKAHAVNVIIPKNSK